MELSEEHKTHALAEYIGKLNNSRMEGKGAYWFDSGKRYEGEFKDGMFHGKGVLHFPNGSKYYSTWRNGKAIDGKYVFPDGLEYENDNDILSGWRYCSRVWDRRFYKEMTDGLRPVDHSMMSAESDEKGKPLRDIPSECYDCGDGYYDPRGRVVYQYAEDQVSSTAQARKFLRNVTADEHEWIIKHCRKGRDEQVGCLVRKNYKAELEMRDAMGRLSMSKHGSFKRKYSSGKVIPNSTLSDDTPQTNQKKIVKFTLS